MIEDVEEELKLVELEAEKVLELKLVLGLGLEEVVAFIAEALELGLATEMALELGLGLEEDVAVVEEAVELEEGAAGDEMLEEEAMNLSSLSEAWLLVAAAVVAAVVADVADPPEEASLVEKVSVDDEGAVSLVLETKAKKLFPTLNFFERFKSLQKCLVLGAMQLMVARGLFQCKEFKSN